MTYEFARQICLELGDTEARHEAEWFAVDVDWSAGEAGSVYLERVKIGALWLSAPVVTEMVGRAAVQRQTELTATWWADEGLPQRHADELADRADERADWRREDAE